MATTAAAAPPNFSQSVPSHFERGEEDARRVAGRQRARLLEREDRRRGRRRRGSVLGARGRGGEERNGERRRERAAERGAQRSVPGGAGRGAPSASPTNGTKRTGRTLFSV